jgi:hypothetical protein
VSTIDAVLRHVHGSVAPGAARADLAADVREHRLAQAIDVAQPFVSGGPALVAILGAFGAGGDPGLALALLGHLAASRALRRAGVAVPRGVLALAAEPVVPGGVYAHAAVRLGEDGARLFVGGQPDARRPRGALAGFVRRGAPLGSLLRAATPSAGLRSAGLAAFRWTGEGRGLGVDASAGALLDLRAGRAALIAGLFGALIDATVAFARSPGGRHLAADQRDRAVIADARVRLAGFERLVRRAGLAVDAGSADAAREVAIAARFAEDTLMYFEPICALHGPVGAAPGALPERLRRDVSALVVFGPSRARLRDAVLGGRP